jgi:hypothetical protein
MPGRTGEGSSSQNAVALRWLRTESGPQDRIAAISLVLGPAATWPAR